jgi:hypothetical protein
MEQTLAEIAFAFPLHCPFVVLQRRQRRWRAWLHCRLLVANAPPAVLFFNVVVGVGFDLGVLVAGGPGCRLGVLGLLLPCL